MEEFFWTVSTTEAQKTRSAELTTLASVGRGNYNIEAL